MDFFLSEHAELSIISLAHGLSYLLNLNYSLALSLMKDAKRNKGHEYTGIVRHKFTKCCHKLLPYCFLFFVLSVAKIGLLQASHNP